MNEWKENWEGSWKKEFHGKREQGFLDRLLVSVPLVSSPSLFLWFLFIPFLFLPFFPFLPDDLIHHCPNHGVHLILSVSLSLSLFDVCCICEFMGELLFRSSVFLLLLSFCANFLLCFVSPFHVMSVSLSVSASVFSILEFSCLLLTDFLSLTLITCLPKMQCFYWNCENFLLCLSFLFPIFSSLSSVNLHSLCFLYPISSFVSIYFPTRQGVWRINYKSKGRNKTRSLRKVRIPIAASICTKDSISFTSFTPSCIFPRRPEAELVRENAWESVVCILCASSLCSLCSLFLGIEKEASEDNSFFLEDERRSTGWKIDQQKEGWRRWTWGLQEKIYDQQRKEWSMFLWKEKFADKTGHLPSSLSLSSSSSTYDSQTQMSNARNITCKTHKKVRTKTLCWEGWTTRWTTRALITILSEQ